MKAISILLGSLFVFFLACTDGGVGERGFTEVLEEKAGTMRIKISIPAPSDNLTVPYAYYKRPGSHEWLGRTLIGLKDTDKRWYNIMENVQKDIDRLLLVLGREGSIIEWRILTDFLVRCYDGGHTPHIKIIEEGGRYLIDTISPGMIYC